MTNYEMVAKKLEGTGKPYAQAAKAVFDLWKGLRLNAVSGSSYEEASAVQNVDIVNWLFMEASGALVAGLAPCDLVQDDEGNYCIVTGFTANCDAINYVDVQGADGQIRSVHFKRLKKADVSKQVLDIVRNRIVKDLTDACPVLKGAPILEEAGK